jgi:hypothetical protein
MFSGKSKRIEKIFEINNFFAIEISYQTQKTGA